MSTGSTPADCEASSTKGTPCSRHSSAMPSTGSTKPNTFETCVQTQQLAPGSLALKASSAAGRSKSGERATSMSAPSMCSGRVTALCS